MNKMIIICTILACTCMTSIFAYTIKRESAVEQMKIRRECRDCKRKGYIEIICGDCAGRGCDACNNKGKIKTKCSTCNGTGWVSIR